MEKKTIEYYEAQIDVSQAVLAILEQHLHTKNEVDWAYKAFREVKLLCESKESEGYREQELILADMAEQARE